MEVPTRTRTHYIGVAVAQACPAIALPVPEFVAFDLNPGYCSCKHGRLDGLWKAPYQRSEMFRFVAAALLH